MNTSAYLINMAWIIFNFLGAFICIKVAYQKPIFRLNQRIIVDEDISIELYDESGNLCKGKLLDISGTGAGILLERNDIDNTYSFERDDLIKLKFLNHNIVCKVCRFNKNNILRLEFNHLNPEEMKFIMIIFTEFMQPFYKNNKNPNYII